MVATMLVMATASAPASGASFADIDAGGHAASPEGCAREGFPSRLLLTRPLAISGSALDGITHQAESPDTGKIKAAASCPAGPAEPAPKIAARPACKKLTAEKGVNYGPSGKETWYDLDMSGCVYLMNCLGYSSEDYPYWIREDGCKMFGEYIMAAADLDVRPKGTIIECSLGTAIVVDTGRLEPYQLDIAVDWES